MTLRLNYKWVWDFWFARDGGDYHIFYLQAPRSLGNPDLRQTHASIGHAVSKDLQNWDVQPDALAPSNLTDAWDNYATRTGSFIRHNGCWFMFYTGTNRTEKGLIQRIGLATSYDLIKWERYLEDPKIKIDPRWYEVLDLEMWHEQAYGICFSVLSVKNFQNPVWSDLACNIKQVHTILCQIIPLGPYTFLTDKFLFGDEIGSIYSGKVILNPKGEWNFIVCNQFAPGKHFIGEISDPVPIAILPDGQIVNLKSCEKSHKENNTYER